MSDKKAFKPKDKSKETPKASTATQLPHTPASAKNKMDHEDHGKGSE